MKSYEIKKIFLDYFAEREHRIVKSASLIPQSDPTLLFTNAGMVPFKSMFLGQEKKDYKRAVSSQKCMRVGGKHNDLEVVGKTDRHHTFFEMLGNFSFGDYFKEEAIEFAWDFLTNELAIQKDKLCITVYKDDEEAREIWRDKVGVPEKYIISLGEKDNFWSMGDTGPCGPCSEIHYDKGSEFAGCGQPDCDVACDCGRFVEIWNLVFMQFNRGDDGKLTPLPNPSIDTGMGLERISALIQGVDSNFDTDLFRPIISGMEKITAKKYGDSVESDISFRVIADHARAVSFLIADDILPSNEGRGYILRRIIRRAARHGKMMGLQEPFLYRAADIVVDTMNNSYPELIEKRDMIAKIVKREEDNFSETLEYGMQLLEDILETNEKNGISTISGNDAFKLYDTFGFPIDLTIEVAEERGLDVDIAEYKKAMEEQKIVARSSWKGDKGDKDNQYYLDLLDDLPQTLFFGYNQYSSESTIIALIKDGKRVNIANQGDEIELLLDKSVFYGESGGQVGDTGKILGNGLDIDILDTQKPVADLLIHKGKIRKGSITEGDRVNISINREKREDIERNHSATHILHSALRKVLGNHVKQSGSSVSSERLRFDYSHFSPPTIEELERIEAIANEAVLNNISVETEEKSLDEAMDSGATALFGEKYGESVRVVKMNDFSLELCGGCHVSATGRIGLIKIVDEGSVAAGVRRIEAYTGRESYKYISKSISNLLKVQELLNVSPNEEIDRLQRILDKNRELEKALNKIREERIKADLEGDAAKAREIKGVKVLAKKIDGADMNTLRIFIDSSRNKLKSGAVIAASVANNKVLLAVGVTKDMTNKLHAGKIVEEVAKLVDGKGGGRPDMAQAGGNNPAKLAEAIDKTYKIVDDMLS